MRFWCVVGSLMVPYLNNQLDETRGFLDELSPSNTRGNLTRLAKEWHDTTLLHGTTHCWEVGSVESSSVVWTCAEWTIPACRNSFYGQNVWLVGTVFLMCQGRYSQCNGKIRSLPTWWLISPDAFTMTPWWRPPAWQLSTAHGGGYGTTSPASTDVMTNQASAHIQMSWASSDKHRSNPTLPSGWAGCYICPAPVSYTHLTLPTNREV